MFELLKDICEFMDEKERDKTVKVEWKTAEQADRDRFEQQALAHAKALDRYMAETDPVKKRKIGNLIAAGIDDIDKYLDKM